MLSQWVLQVVLVVFFSLVPVVLPVCAQEDKLEPLVEKDDADFIFAPSFSQIEIKPTLFEKIISDMTFTSYVKEEMAFRVVQPLTFTKVMTSVQLETSYNIGSYVSFYARVFGFYDSVYLGISPDNISPRKGPEVVLSDAPEEDEINDLDIKNIRDIDFTREYAELKELFFDVHLESVDLRVGRQIVRWGVVEGSRVTDEINPLDMGEFILRDLTDRYIPLWMLKADYYLAEHTLGLILIPNIRFHQPAAEQTEWEQFTFLDNLVFPKHGIRNMEVALKISQYVLGVDASISYFYTWDDFPVAFRSLVNTGRFGVSPDVNFRPIGDRLHIFGTTASTSFGKFILNSELAYVKGKFFGADFGTEDSEGGLVFGGEVEKDYVKYAISVDLVFFGFDLSLQGIQQYVIRYDGSILQDRLDSIFGLFSRREFMDNRLVPQILIIHFQNNFETLYRPRVDYSVTDQLKISFGMDILNGHIAQTRSLGKYNFVGFFRNNDRIYFEVKYSF